MTKVTVPSLLAMKKQGQRIVALTCYDFTAAQCLNAAGVDLLLVGDSLGMVKLGYASTLPVTVDDMRYHTRIVARGNSRALLVTDMPFLSCQVSVEDAVRNCGLMLQEGAEAVKIEGGREMIPALEALRRAKIPVMGHLGMTPQSVHLIGGYRVQGRDPAARRRLLAEAKALESAGAFAIVLECVPPDLARAVSKALAIPTIGIGAGASCDGQILVLDDMLGYTADPAPRFVKRYARFRAAVQEAVARYGREVRAGKFPDERHTYSASYPLPFKLGDI